MHFLKSVQVIASAGLMALASLAAPALAEGPSARVVVPDHPQGVGLGGCYQVAERLYGPYSMTFCLKNRGNYSVTGGGLNCSGGLTWSVAGRNINIRLQRTSCGRGKAWSADTLQCQGNGILSGLIPFVVVPNIPNLAALRCTYTPSAHGYKPVTIRARRIS